MAENVFAHRIFNGTVCLCVATVMTVLMSHGASAQTTTDKLEKCVSPVGTLAVNEPESQVLTWLRSYSLESPSALLRMFAQESNCFIVVERGAGLRNMQQERQFAAGGDLQSGSNIGQGQMVGADFVLTPYVQFSDNNAGGIGGAVGGIGRRLGLGAGAGLKFKEAQTNITVAATRTGVQVASAEGKARQRDFSLGGLGFAAGLLGGAGAYSSTAEGKVIAASLLDNFNGVVQRIRTNPNLKPLSAAQVSALVSGAPQAGAVFHEGDVVRSKIDGVKMLKSASDGAATVATLTKADELVVMGAEQDGFVPVLSSKGEGWVKKALVTK